jgi:hypothetical protein
VSKLELDPDFEDFHREQGIIEWISTHTQIIKYMIKVGKYSPWVSHRILNLKSIKFLLI